MPNLDVLTGTITIELGGTWLRIAIINNGSHQCISPVILETPNNVGDLLELIQRNVDSLLKKSGYTATHGGIAVAGRVDRERTRIIKSGKLSFLIDSDFVIRLNSVYGIKFRVANDVEAAAAAFSLIKPGRSLTVVSLSTGIGGCHVFYGADGKPILWPGEPGHMKTSYGKFLRCQCGELGCLETAFGGLGIELWSGQPAVRLSNEQWHIIADALAEVLTNMLRATPTDELILVGNIVNNQPIVLNAIKENVEQLGEGCTVLLDSNSMIGLQGAYALAHVL